MQRIHSRHEVHVQAVLVVCASIQGHVVGGFLGEGTVESLWVAEVHVNCLETVDCSAVRRRIIAGRPGARIALHVSAHCHRKICVLVRWWRGEAASLPVRGPPDGGWGVREEVSLERSKCLVPAIPVARGKGSLACGIGDRAARFWAVDRGLRGRGPRLALSCVVIGEIRLDGSLGAFKRKSDASIVGIVPSFTSM